jgi:hypothetical protein
MNKKQYLIKQFETLEEIENFINKISAEYELHNLINNKENFIVIAKLKNELEIIKLKLESIKIKQEYEPYLSKSEKNVLNDLLKK